METRVTVLNERNGEWPGGDNLFSSHTGKMCCLGCNGLTFGIGRQDMDGIPLPTDLRHLQHAKFKDLWMQEAPLGLVEELKEMLQPYTNWHNHSITLEGIASSINDYIAVVEGETESAVKALRVLFRYVGDLAGERWVIRHLRA